MKGIHFHERTCFLPKRAFGCLYPQPVSVGISDVTFLCMTMQMVKRNTSFLVNRSLRVFIVAVQQCVDLSIHPCRAFHHWLRFLHLFGLLNAYHEDNFSLIMEKRSSHTFWPIIASFKNCGVPDDVSLSRSRISFTSLSIVNSADRLRAH